MKISYIRLISGDELIGEVSYPNTDTMRVTNPLSLVGVTDGFSPKRYVYMTRYTPYVAKQSLDFNRDLVLLVEPTSEHVAEYYRESLVYCQEKTDKGFESGITEATSVLKRVNAGQFEEEEEDMASSILRGLMGVANTQIN